MASATEKSNLSFYFISISLNLKIPTATVLGNTGRAHPREARLCVPCSVGARRARAGDVLSAATFSASSCDSGYL